MIHPAALVSRGRRMLPSPEPDQQAAFARFNEVLLFVNAAAVMRSLSALKDGVTGLAVDPRDFLVLDDLQA